MQSDKTITHEKIEKILHNVCRLETDNWHKRIRLAIMETDELISSEKDAEITSQAAIAMGCKVDYDIKLQEKDAEIKELKKEFDIKCKVVDRYLIDISKQNKIIEELKSKLKEKEKESEHKLNQSVEILRYAEVLDNIDDDVAKAVLKAVKQDKISLAELTQSMQNIKNKQLQDLIPKSEIWKVIFHFDFTADTDGERDLIKFKLKQKLKI